jgi:RNA polymerase sigma-70 factor (ECF subfamily)
MRTLPPRDRSKEAFEALYGRLGERLLVFLARRVQDVDTAAELWAESWASAYEGWHRCRAAEPGQQEAWVLGIARHQLAGYYRSGAIERRACERLGWSVPEVDADEHEEIERRAELLSLRSLLSAALEELPVRRRRAVQFRVVAGLPYGDVADRLGCSEQAARAHVSRGLRSLAKALEDTEVLRAAGGGGRP